ncbi:MAG: DM9 repeat-containing protein [Acidobacteriota bacterium]
MTPKISLAALHAAVLMCFPATAFGQWTGADFGLDPQSTEAGFVDVSNPQSTPNIQQMTMTLPKKNGSFTATLSTASVSGLEFRNRSAVTGGDVPLLLGDLVGTRNAGGGQMSLVLSGLDDGWYQFESWHNDSDGGGPGFSQNSTIGISLNGSVQVSNLVTTNTTDGTAAAKGTFLFQILSGSTASIDFTHVSYDPALPQMVPLSGFAVSRLDYWADASGGTIPAGSFVGGTSAGGADISICRVMHSGELRPGRIDSHSGSPGCHISLRNQPHNYNGSYEVLQAPAATWQAWTGSAPASAIVATVKQSGNQILICQAPNPNAPSTLIPGKLNPQGICKIIYGITATNPGTVKAYSSGFNVLVQN